MTSKTFGPSQAPSRPTLNASAKPERMFIVGSPRSGTTLVQRLVSTTFGLYTLPETHLMPQLRPRHPLSVLRLVGPRAVTAAGRSLGSANRLTRFHHVPHRRSTILRRSAIWLDATAITLGLPGWVEKTPRHLHYVDELTRELQPRFIHVIRDGASVVASVASVTRHHSAAWGGARDERTAALRWSQDIERHRRCATTSGHFFLRYEDLIDDETRTLEALGAAMCVPPASTQLRALAAGTFQLRDDEPWVAEAGGAVAPRSLSTPSPSERRQTFDRATTRAVTRAQGRVEDLPFV